MGNPVVYRIYRAWQTKDKPLPSHRRCFVPAGLAVQRCLLCAEPSQHEESVVAEPLNGFCPLASGKLRCALRLHGLYSQGAPELGL